MNEPKRKFRMGMWSYIREVRENNVRDYEKQDKLALTVLLWKDGWLDYVGCNH